MTHAEFFKAVCEIADRAHHKGCVTADVIVWRRDDGATDLEWRAYASDPKGAMARSASPVSTLEIFAAELAASAVPLPTTAEGVGDVAADLGVA